MQYARLVHDYQWMRFKSRTATPGWVGFSSTPETVPLCLHPNQGAPKDEIKLNEGWQEYTRGINPPAGYRLIMIPKTGWLNKNDSADTLGFGGNVVEIQSVERNFARIKALNFYGDPPNAESCNFETNPELVHKFTVITRTGDVINPADGIDSFNFLIGRKPLYVPFDRLELFPKLPVKIRVNPTTLPWLLARERPDKESSKTGKFLPLEPVTIEEYAPRGTNVWGRTPRGWIGLCLYPWGGRLRYLTTWKMKTLPPPPAKVN